MSRGRGKQRRSEVPDQFFWPAENEHEWRCLWPRQCVRVMRCRRVVGDVASPWSITVAGAKDDVLRRDDLSEDNALALLRSLPNPLPRAWLEFRGFRLT